MRKGCIFGAGFGPYPICYQYPAVRRFSCSLNTTQLANSRGGSLTSLQQRLVKAGGRLIKQARYYWLLLAEGHLHWRLFFQEKLNGQVHQVFEGDAYANSLKRPLSFFLPCTLHSDSWRK